MPGISAKTVHFPPQLGRGTGSTGLSGRTCSLSLGISTLGESAGNSCENGSLSPVADRGTGSTGLSHRICHSHLSGKCREFPRKRFTFPRGRPGCRLHSRLSPHLQSLPPGESAGNFHENGSLSPAAGRGTGSTGISGRTWHFHPWGKCRVFLRKRFTFPRGRPGHRLHSRLSPHLQSLPPGESAGFFRENGSLSPAA